MKRRRAGKAEPDPAGVAAGGATRRDDGMLDAIEDRARFGQQRFAGLGQLDAARLAAEQLHLELGFEGADLLAQRRLLDAESFRRAGDMPLLGDGDEITEVPQFHLRYSDHMDRASVIYWTGAISATTFPSESRHQPRRRSAMATEAKLLTVQFLKWMAERPRSYAEVRAAWSSTCPLNCAWEDAITDDLVERLADGHLALTARGHARLTETGVAPVISASSSAP